MIRFNNDYSRGMHPAILEALAQYNESAYAGYGEDEWCSKAAALIRTLTGQPEADIYFFPGATQANFIITAAALRPTQSVISPQSGHINCHEAASIENTGHKILALPHQAGKISAEQILSCAGAYYDGGMPEYLTEPKLVYLSFPTEYGTRYFLEELRAIREVCTAYGMYLFIDGARLGYGLGAPGNDVTLQALAALADVFYIGGTKCGAMLGEAAVIRADALKYRFKSTMKQNGAVLAKGWLLGLQFYTLLHSGEYFTATARADRLALEIQAAFVEKGIPLYVDSDTNQQFVILNAAQEKALAAKYIFEYEGTAPGGTIVRFCTSWATTRAEVDALLADIRAL